MPAGHHKKSHTMATKSLKEMFAEQLASQTYKESYMPAGEAFPLKDVPSLYEDVVRARCVEREQMNSEGETFHSRSICLVKNDGSAKYIPCTVDSILSNGDEVDVESIMITPLERAGEIKFRGDGLVKE